MTVKCNFSSSDVGQHHPGLCPLRGRDFLFYIQKARSAPLCPRVCVLVLDGGGVCEKDHRAFKSEVGNCDERFSEEEQRAENRLSETREKKTDNGEQ